MHYDGGDDGLIERVGGLGGHTAGVAFVFVGQFLVERDRVFHHKL